MYASKLMLLALILSDGAAALSGDTRSTRLTGQRYHNEEGSSETCPYQAGITRKLAG